MPISTPTLPSDQVQKFQAYIYRFFDQVGRHQLPWRLNYAPYQIMVSEIMLQQTQVDRVIPKFTAFLEKFPTVEALAKATVAEVILAWQGLGYNRRGLNLQKAAQKIVADFQGQVPSTLDDLISLPGIGPYTAAAIQAFAFNQPSQVIETNIRTVFIFHFFHQWYQVEDQAILAMIDLTMDRQQPRKWYSALMDYGSYLKQVIPNPTRRSKTYAKQTKFEGSNRQVRGQVLRLVGTQGQSSYLDLQKAVTAPADKLQPILEQLVTEGFLATDSGHDHYRLNDK